MRHKGWLLITGILISIVVVFLVWPDKKTKQESKDNVNKLQATILSWNDDKLIVQDQNNIIYTFLSDQNNWSNHDDVIIYYTGSLDQDKQVQDVSITDLKLNNIAKNADGIPLNYLDNGLFKDYYTLAYKKLLTLSLDEKIGQIFLVAYPGSNALQELQKYHFGGYLFFRKDFQNKSVEEVQTELGNLQQQSGIPLLMAVDEEGGTVIRVSSNPNLAASPFKSPRELYLAGGFPLIYNDTIAKSKLLDSLKLNLNLAPVVDVSTNEDDYIYKRTIGENQDITSEYAKTVIKASKEGKVSYTLKHFPGYGNNLDTHVGSSVDERSYEDWEANDLPPFKAGIEEKAEAVLVGHQILKFFDENMPASLSTNIHNFLRDSLSFTGIIMTDDIAMAALDNEDNNQSLAKLGLLAGNDLIITTDYPNSIKEIKEALNSGSIKESTLNRAVFRILAWKYYKGLMFDNTK